MAVVLLCGPSEAAYAHLNGRYRRGGDAAAATTSQTPGLTPRTGSPGWQDLERCLGRDAHLRQLADIVPPVLSPVEFALSSYPRSPRGM